LGQDKENLPDSGVGGLEKLRRASKKSSFSQLLGITDVGNGTTGIELK
jgi:hypothetical protein